MDWENLHAGEISQDEIDQYIDDNQWQELRQELEGASLQEKYDKLRQWLSQNDNSRRAQVQVTNYINALARGGEIPAVEKNYLTISKVDDDKNLVFGFAYTSVDKHGNRIYDHSGEFVDPKDLEEAAYLFNLEFRASGVMHKGDAIGDLVESFVITKDKMRMLGLDYNTLPQAWWVGFYIHDDDIFEKIKKGKYKMFSIQGISQREEVEE